MTPDQIRALQEAVDANKRMLQVLDGRLEELSRLEKMRHLEQPWGWLGEDMGRQPYFYGAVSSDLTEQSNSGNLTPGILVTTQSKSPPFILPSGAEDDTRFTGMVQIQEDAPFVWTHIMATGRVEVPYEDEQLVQENQQPSRTQPFPFVSLSGLSPAGNSLFPKFDLGFVERGSGRVLFESQRADRLLAGNPNDKNQLLPSTLFDTQRVFFANGGSNANVEGVSAAAPGHGPSSAFELPAEVLLPQSGTVEVQVRPLGLWNQAQDLGGGVSLRLAFYVYVTLCGYKILEE
jgi:hypothetical protein